MDLAEARRRVFNLAKDKPVPCPCCSQTVFLYRRTIYSTMVRQLIDMYRHAGRDWFHLPTVVGSAGGDSAKLRYWGLIEESVGIREDGGRAGWWRITEAGQLFVKRLHAVPKYAYVFNGACQRLDGPLVDIQDCLGEKFDLRELFPDIDEGWDTP